MMSHTSATYFGNVKYLISLLELNMVRQGHQSKVHCKTDCLHEQLQIIVGLETLFSSNLFI